MIRKYKRKLVNVPLSLLSHHPSHPSLATCNTTQIPKTISDPLYNKPYIITRKSKFINHASLQSFNRNSKSLIPIPIPINDKSICLAYRTHLFKKLGIDIWVVILILILILISSHLISPLPQNNRTEQWNNNTKLHAYREIITIITTIRKNSKYTLKPLSPNYLSRVINPHHSLINPLATLHSSIHPSIHITTPHHNRNAFSKPPSYLVAIFVIAIRTE